MYQKILGGLLGGAVGDAMGAPTEGVPQSKFCSTSVMRYVILKSRRQIHLVPEMRQGS